jgi:hypothetical protein
MMISEDSKLQLEQQGDLYILSNVIDGQSQTMKMSAADVLKISRSAQQLQERILGSISQKGATSNVFVPVARIEIDHTLHQDEILLRLDDSNGYPSRFLLTFQYAENLARQLIARVADLRKATQNQKTQ